MVIHGYVVVVNEAGGDAHGHLGNHSSSSRSSYISTFGHHHEDPVDPVETQNKISNCISVTNCKSFQLVGTQEHGKDSMHFCEINRRLNI